MPIGVDEKYFGYDGFIWFIGVVEDVNDPEMVSRVKIRILGHHAESSKILPTSDLMWATTMMPTTSASYNGIGHSPSGLQVGSYVFGFWMDGEYAQQPVVIGTWHGVASNSDIEGLPDGSAGTPDTHPLARGENTIADVVDEAIESPYSAYAASYPYNKVYATESGHIVEFDDTPGAERFRLYHSPSGTRMEIHPNGDFVQVNANKWNITVGNDRLRVTGGLKIVVDGNADISVGNNAYIAVENDVNATVGLNMTAVIGNDFNGEIQHNANLLVKNNVNMNVSNNVTMTVANNVTSYIGNTLTATVKTLSTIVCPTTNWTGDINLVGDLNITGTSTASVDHISAGISGKGHTHAENGTGGGTTDPPS